STITFLSPHKYTHFPYTSLYRFRGHETRITPIKYRTHQQKEAVREEQVRLDVADVVAAPNGPCGLGKKAFSDGQLANRLGLRFRDRKSTRLNSSHSQISYAVFCL